MTRARLLWLALAAAVIVAVVVAATAGSSRRPTPADRADAIARVVRCPTCRGQSVAESAAPAAQAIRLDIRQRIDQGQSRAEIEQYLQTRYGQDILLTPPGRGVGGLVWILPVVAVAVAAVALGLSLRRWSRRSLARPSEDDRALVAREALK